MDWMSWKTWTVMGLIIVALFAIYTFAATQSARITIPEAESRPVKNTPPQRVMPAVAPGVGVIHTEYLESQSGSYRSARNLFAYKEPPPPPPPPPPQPVPQPRPQPQPPPEPQPPPPISVSLHRHVRYAEQPDSYIFRQRRNPQRARRREDPGKIHPARDRD